MDKEAANSIQANAISWASTATPTEQCQFLKILIRVFKDEILKGCGNVLRREKARRNAAKRVKAKDQGESQVEDKPEKLSRGRYKKRDPNNSSSEVELSSSEECDKEEFTESNQTSTSTGSHRKEKETQPKDPCRKFSMGRGRGRGVPVEDSSSDSTEWEVVETPSAGRGLGHGMIFFSDYSDDEVWPSTTNARCPRLGRGRGRGIVRFAERDTIIGTPSSYMGYRRPVVEPGSALRKMEIAKLNSIYKTNYQSIYPNFWPKNLNPSDAVVKHDSANASFEAMANGQTELELYLIEIFEDDGSLMLSIGKDCDNTVKLKVDPIPSLAKSEWWTLNRKLFKDKVVVLRRAVNEFIKQYLSGAIIIGKNDLRKVDDDEFAWITMDILKDKDDVLRFEEVLVEQSNPVVLMRKDDVKKAELLGVEGEKLYLGLHDSLYFAVKNLLKDPKRKRFVQPRDQQHYRMYEMYYNVYGVTDFLAPIGDCWDQLYRVRLSNYNRISKQYDALYLDTGATAILTVNKLACMTRMSKLPPFFNKLPPQMVKVLMTEVSKIEIPFANCVELIGSDVIVKVAKPGIISPIKNFPPQIRLFRCPTSLEETGDSAAVRKYLKWIQDLDVNLRFTGNMEDVRNNIYNIWRQFSKGEDCPTSKDPVYELFFASRVEPPTE